MVNPIVKRFETPDEVRHFEKGRFEVVRIGSMGGRRVASLSDAWFRGFVFSLFSGRIQVSSR